MPLTRPLATCLLAGAVFAGRPAQAQTAGNTQPADAQQRDGGFLRLSVGPGYLNATLGQQDLPAEMYSGAGVAFAVELGRPLTSRVTLGAKLSGILALDARAADGAGELTGTPTADLDKASLGANFTYTIPSSTSPWHLYLSADPALTVMWVTYHHGMGLDTGLLGALAPEIGFVVGCDWHVASAWRLGVAGEARLALLPHGQTSERMSEYALFLSATYD